jgi:hypothetical protein
MCLAKRAGLHSTQEEKLRLAEIALAELGDKTIVFSGVMQTTTRACTKRRGASASACTVCS